MVTDPGGHKQAMEIHLCLAHAAEMGIITPAAAEAAEQGALQAVTHDPLQGFKSTAIVPTEPTEMGLALSRSSSPKTDLVCGACGMTWATFKQNGVLGCARCYEMFEVKLLPLVKRAQENFGQHAGKVPPGAVSDPARQVTTARLRRELEQALTQENYEAAAKLRDELRVLGQN
jgi:protein arginine kinase activator